MGRGCLTGDSAHYLLKNHSFYRRIVSGPVFSGTAHSHLENFTAWKEIGYNVQAGMYESTRSTCVYLGEDAAEQKPRNPLA